VRKTCGDCKACTRQDCNECESCRDMRKYGGP
uniref:CXXC-type domain-containing protein n=1 Tax=Amphimedon queenslandica TaxID=400682 RepID=A0A1X7TFS0_AMPQE